MTPTAHKRPEWIGKTPDTAVPSWVKSRVLDAQDDRCAECRNDFCAHPVRRDGPSVMTCGAKTRSPSRGELCRSRHHQYARSRARARPTHYSFTEAFTSKLRADCPNAHRFRDIADAREKLVSWRRG